MNLNVLEDIAFNVVTLFLYRAELVSGNGRFCGLFTVVIYPMIFFQCLGMGNLY